MMAQYFTSKARTANSSRYGEKSKTFEGRSDNIGKKKKNQEDEPLDITTDSVQPSTSPKWPADFSNYSYDQFVKMSAESILEAMHIASANESVEGMLNASIQWGDLAALVRDSGKRKIGFGGEDSND